MSNPSNQRADGCSVFFSILLGLLFVGSYFLFQQFFDIEDDKKITDMISNERAVKISAFSNESAKFINNVDTFYSDKNFSLRSAMEETLNSYNTKIQPSDN